MILYKLKVTNKEFYSVKPSQGIIKSGTKTTVKIFLDKAKCLKRKVEVGNLICKFL